MKKYFRLNPYVHISEGNNECAIYNNLNGKVYGISNEEYHMLNKCEQNVPLKKINNINYDFILNVKNNGLGLDYDSQVFINREFYGTSKALKKILKRNLLDNLFIELTNECNLNCEFCNYDNILYRKTGCKRWESKFSPLSENEWEKIIDQAIKLQCSNFIIIGGEPFFNYGKLKKIVEHINKHENMRITIFTNGVLLNNDEIIKFIKRNNIKICLQILSDNNSTYKIICKSEKIFDAVSSSVNKLVKNNIPHNILFLINKYNENEVERISHTFKDSSIKFEFIYPIKNNFYSHKYIEQMYDRSKNFIKPSLPLFEKLSNYNFCYKNTLAVSCDGLIYYSIMSRKLYLGNIKNLSLCEVLSTNKAHEVAELCKEKIDGCSSCNRKYGCLDCRALEMSATDNILGMEFCNLLKGNVNELL